MPLRHIFSAIAAVSLLALATPARALDFKPGNWKLVLTQSVKGMPGGFQRIEWQECLTKSDPIPKAYLNASGCQVLEQKMVYRTLHYKMSCYSEHGTLTNVGKIHFGDFRISGSSKSDMGVVDGQNMIVRYKFQGRRVGDCR